MKIARVSYQGRAWLARIEEPLVYLLKHESSHPRADALQEALAAGTKLTGGKAVFVEDVRLLAPLAHPGKIIAIGLNYADHAREGGMAVPERPLVFSKPSSAIIGPGETISYAADTSQQVDYEAELAVVIGTTARGTLQDPLSHVFGYTICNDVSARDAQFADVQWVRAKSFDTFCPLGPWIVTTAELPDPQVLGIGTTMDGEKLQNGTTADMIFPVAELITYLARFMTLEPGDVIATGTPFGVGFARVPPRFLLEGDTVTCWVEGIGELTNPVAVT